MVQASSSENNYDQTEPLSLDPDFGNGSRTPGVFKASLSWRGVPDLLQEPGAFAGFGIPSETRCLAGSS